MQKRHSREEVFAVWLFIICLCVCAFYQSQSETQDEAVVTVTITAELRQSLVVGETPPPTYYQEKTGNGKIVISVGTLIH